VIALVGSKIGANLDPSNTLIAAHALVRFIRLVRLSHADDLYSAASIFRSFFFGKINLNNNNLDVSGLY
jgi:hypothetical protein